jgi:hypothetical protein
MEHLPYETWIFEQASLSEEQGQALQAHLQECAQCRALLQGWQAVHQQIQATGTAGPIPGFSLRFQTGLAERRAYQQQMQLRRILLGFITVSLLFFGVLMAYLLLTSSPVDWLVKLMEFGMGTITNFHVLQQFVSSWLHIVPLSIPLALWIMFSTGFVILVAGWAFTLWRVTTQGVANK